MIYEVDLVLKDQSLTYHPLLQVLFRLQMADTPTSLVFLLSGAVPVLL